MVNEELITRRALGTSGSAYFVSLHTVLLGTSRHGGGDFVPPLGCVNRVGLQRLLQELLLLRSPGSRSGVAG